MLKYLQRQGTLLVALNLVLFTCFLQCVTSREIWLNLNRQVGEDNVTCLEKSNNLPCRSLEYVSESVTNDCSNLTIWIQPRKIELSKVAKFQNCYDLRIVSERSTFIKCKSPDAKSNSTGFQFNNITGLWLKNLIFSSCHSKYPKSMTSKTLIATLMVDNSNDVTLENIHFIKSRPTAVMFIDTYGTVVLINCSFKYNRLFKTPEQIFSYPGGVYIEFTKNETEAIFNITYCFFVKNTAPDEFVEHTQGHSQLVPNGNWRGQGHGGGLDIIFTDFSHRISILILNCTFKNNKARWGGGMYFHFQKKASNNSVLVHNTRFEGNKASIEGGGINIGFLQVRPLQNKVVIMNCSFSSNSASTGGGTSLFAVHRRMKINAGKEIVFQNCTWSKNKGRSSAAVDITPSQNDRLNQGFLVIPMFKNCTFVNNTLKSVDIPTHIRPNRTFTITQYSGVFTITNTIVVFDGSTEFINNSFTALHATSSRLVFKQKSNVEFHGNQGEKGGAIAMYGFSSLVVNSDSSFKFTNNLATSVGGAMYYETSDQNDFNSARKCFIQYQGSKKIEARNVNFTFTGNRANNGTSIYSSSFYPCFFEWFDSLEVRLSDFFDKIAFFNFDDNNNSLATNGRHYKLEFNQYDRLATIPGKEMTVPLRFLDEFKKSRETAYTLSVSANSTTNLHPEYTVGTTASFYGEPLEHFILKFSAQHVVRISAVMNVSLLPCPPGFYYNNMSMSCECAADNTVREFVGMPKCNTTAFYAYIHYGFWGGYDSLNRFYTALCPLSFCNLTTSSSNPRHLHMHALPSSKDELNDVMCGTSRTGILCGECRVNYSVYYHSRHFECKQNQFCKLGILFYILSEIFPTVILFSVIIAFNISFTSGNMNGFIFFCQVLSTIILNMETHNNYIMATIPFINIFYGILNLDFFNIDKLSFCLWEGATVMDILVFKYVTIIFALLLVVGLIVLMNSRLCTKFNNKVKMNLSVIHGLSAFLVICYTQCTKISFYILTRVVLGGEGGVDGPAVTFFGGIPYMKGKHLLYVIPALICLVTITIIPPLLLLIYPLLYQLLSLCGLSEHRIVTRVSNAIAINKLMPIFDSFQSCYKDKLRFFAGLYFVYRIVILAAYSISKSTTQFYIVAGFILLFISGVHSFVQPYKKISTNRIDSLLFSNLVFITLLTLFYAQYAVTVESQENPGILDQSVAVLNAANIFQMIFISFPLVVIVCWLLFVTTRKVIQHFRNRRENLNDTTTENDNDELLHCRDLGEETQYFELTDHDHDTENETLNNTY